MSLDDELDIPISAQLPSNDAEAARLETAAKAASIVLSQSTCLRDTGRCLVVGRQASTADLRIQHGSISRKHAALYYHDDGSLHLVDFGGKHGTTVNGQRIPAHKPVVLQNGDTILFGNVRESVFTVKLAAADESPTTRSSIQESSREETAAPTSHHVKDTNILEEAGQGLSGRAKRQAEIAAMMASLDDAPTYQEYKPVETEQPWRNAVADDGPSKTNPVARQHQLPVAELFTLPPSPSDRRHVATCLAVDPAGGRFVVGSSDTHLRCFDFGGMTRTNQEPFCKLIVQDGYPCASAVFSNTGDRVLVATTSVQPVVLTRDGEQVIQFVRGDMYVTDQSRTVGHTAAVTSVDWHPLERDIVLTGSRDGSARLWNLKGKTQFDMLVCDKVFLVKNARGQRTTVTAVCFHPGGREFAVGTACGSIQIWNRSRVSARPERAVYDAHGSGAGIHFLAYNVDGSRLVSRSSEDTTGKVWNAKRLSRSSYPIQTCRGLPTVHETANAVFSPDGRMVCAGASEYREEQGQRTEVGSLKFFKVESSDAGNDVFVDPILSLDLETTNVGPVVVKWHNKLNQIFVGCSDESTIIYYDRKLSSKGALLSANKAVRGVNDLEELLRSRAAGSTVVTGEIITPLTQPRNQGNKKRKREDRTDPTKSHEPERPTTDKMAGGNTSFTQFVSDQNMAKSKVIAGKDPREALFEYKQGKSYIAQAYEGNKERILADKTVEEEEDETKTS